MMHSLNVSTMGIVKMNVLCNVNALWYAVCTILLQWYSIMNHASGS